MSYRISVVICSYTDKRWDDLVAAIESVKCQSPPVAETIVVIDHNPALLERTRERFPDVIVIPNKGRVGLSAGRNTGVSAAKHELIAFLDDDATAEPDWGDTLARCFVDDDVLGVGGRVVPEWSGPPAAWLPEEFYWVIGCSYRGLPQQLAPIRNPPGASMMLRREIFTEVGGFRTEIGRVGTIPLGCEETELSIRATQHQPRRRFLYQPAAIIHHRVWPDRATWRYFWQRCYAEGLSKALVSELVGARDGLSTEFRYVFRALPVGVWRGLSDVITKGDLSGLGRAGAIITGLLVTGCGYLIGKLLPETRRLAESARSSRPMPVISGDED